MLPKPMHFFFVSPRKLGPRTLPSKIGMLYPSLPVSLSIHAQRFLKILIDVKIKVLDEFVDSVAFHLIDSVSPDS